MTVCILLDARLHIESVMSQGYKREDEKGRKEMEASPSRGEMLTNEPAPN